MNGSTSVGSVIQSQRSAPPPPPASVQHSLSQGGGIPTPSRTTPHASNSALAGAAGVDAGNSGGVNIAPLQVKKTPRSHSPHGSKVQSSQQASGGGGGVSGVAPPGSTGTTPRRREPKAGKEKEQSIIRRLQVICTDADPTKLYKSFTKIGQG